MTLKKQTQTRISDLVAFTPRQWDAWRAVLSHRFVLYGGARGGGKSYFLRWGLLLYLLDLARRGVTGVTVGLFCSTYPELRDRQVSKIAGEFPAGLGALRDSQTGGLGFYLRPEYGGSVIALRNLDDPEKYRSAEFAAIAVDELTLTDLDTFNYLRGSLRWAGVDRTVFIAGTNPGGRGHGWVKNLWIDRRFPAEMRAMADEFAFVQSLPADNPHLTSQYWDDLNSLPPALSRAWVHGDWDVFEGQAFAWQADKHIVGGASAVAALPAGWEKWAHWRAVDWGFSNPFSCLWLTRDPDNGRVFVYREAYETGLTDRQQARLILDMTPPDERITLTYADPSMWSSKSSGAVVTSTADEYAAAGVPLTRADNDRLSGKRKVDRLLENLPDGKPGLQVLPACVNLIRTLPTLAYDRTKTEDVDTSQEDHCLIAGTLVATSKGDKPIEKVAVGDMVLTRQGYRRVTRSWLTQRQAEVYQVDFSDGKRLIGTSGHPVFVKTCGFVGIDALKCDDEIITSTEASKWQTQKPVRDRAVRVTGLCKVTERQDVYNLEVEDEHEFFANGVLVHNCYDALRYGLTQAREYHPERKGRQSESSFNQLLGGR